MPQQWLTSNGFLNFLIWLGFIIALIEVLTFIHEGGHLLVAKWNKVDVAEFSIGFGPKIFQFGKKTKYSLRWIPFGGYVSVLTQDVVDILKKVQSQEMTPQEIQQISRQIRPFDIEYDIKDKKVLEKMSAPKKVLFAMGGIIFNFIFMFSAVWISVGTIGEPNPTEDFYIPCSTQIVGGRNSTTIVATTKVEVDTTYNGTTFNPNPSLEIKSFDSFWAYLETFNETPPITNAIRIVTSSTCVEGVTTAGVVTMSFNNAQLRWNVILTDETETNLPFFRVNTNFTNQYFSSTYVFQQYLYEVPANSFVSAINKSFTELGNGFLLLFTFGKVQINNFPTDHQFYTIFSTNQGQNDFIFGWFVFLYYLIIFSALLIIFNILPIPPLDGFRAVEWSVEGATGKKFSPETQAKVTKIGWIVIMVWTIFLLFVPFLI